MLVGSKRAGEHLGFCAALHMSLIGPPD